MIAESNVEAHWGETAPLNPSTSVKNATVEVRLGFVRKVYGLLSVQLLLTVGVATPICMQGPVWAQANSWIFLVSLALMMSSMCVMFCCNHLMRQFPTNYIFLFVYTLGTALLVGLVSADYTYQSVLLAVGLTVGIFVGMTLYAWNTTTDFTGFGPYLFGALLAFIAFGFAISFMGFFGVKVDFLMMVYDFIGVLLFTFFIIFDTQMILGEYGGHKQQFSIDDYVLAAMNLYVDVIQLFLHILSLLGERR